MRISARKAAREVGSYGFLGPAYRNNQTVAAQRQIDAAVSHLLKSELECAITLANGAEGLLPETESRQIFAYLREHPLSKEIDFDKTISWLKHRTQPDAATIFEFEAAVVVARVMSKFAAAYTEVAERMVRVFIVGGCEGALADDPVDEIMKLLGLPVRPLETGARKQWLVLSTRRLCGSELPRGKARKQVLTRLAQDLRRIEKTLGYGGPSRDDGG